MGLKEKSLISFSPNEIDSAATHHLQMCRQGYSLDECPLYHRDTQKGQTPALTDNLRVANQPDTDVLGPWEEVAWNPHRENMDTPGGKPWKLWISPSHRCISAASIYIHICSGCAGKCHGR